MSTKLPGTVGMRLDEVLTPALILDLEAFTRNLEHMARAVEEFGITLRPHAKTHKCAAIALEQMRYGAIGICCQTIGEAERLAENGVSNILITNELLEPFKLDRLALLSKQIDLSVCVDHKMQIDALEGAASKHGADIKVLIEVDVGGRRCGVEPGPSAVELAMRIRSHRCLEFKGIHAYHGKAQHIRSYAERRSAIETSAGLAARTVECLSAAGFPCQVVTGGGTGSYAFEAQSGVYTELQPGSYIFMDADYGRNEGAPGSLAHEFEHSLFVYTQVISVPRPRCAVVDAGLKAIAFDAGPPLMADIAGVVYKSGSDEHGMLESTAERPELQLGTKARLVPGHCDPTVNLYDWIVGVRRNRVAVVWPIIARGASA